MGEDIRRQGVNQVIPPKDGAGMFVAMKKDVSQQGVVM